MYNFVDIKTKLKHKKLLFKTLEQANYNYTYPRGLNLKPGSEVHDKLVDMILDYVDVSYREMSKRYDSWAEVDKITTMYIETDDYEEKVKKADSRKPVSIIIPTSYSLVETLLAYLISVFFESPVFKYEPGDPSDTVGVALLERTVDRGVNRNKSMVNLYTMLRDDLTYGIGVVGAGWARKYGIRRAESGMFKSTVLGETFDIGEEMKRVLLHEGNQLVNIDPYKFFPDPNFSPVDMQKGEFVAYIDRTGLIGLLSEESMDTDVFNVRYLKHIGGDLKSVFWNEGSSGRYEKTGVSPDIQVDKVGNVVDTIQIYVNLVPRDWGLGENEYPEKWFFRLAADQVIIEARRSDLYHDMYPIAANSVTFDGHTLAPSSIVERSFPMQEVVNWLINSHIANVRKSINDMIIYDPSVISTADLSNPGPGKLVRSVRTAWGRSIKDSIMQLKIEDITRQNVGDASFFANLIHETFGTTDPVRGVRRTSGERVTATEIMEDKTAAVSRLEKLARVIGFTSFFDISYMLASNVQQFMSKDVYVKVVGRYQEDLEREYADKVKNGMVRVSSDMLDIYYDVVINDGSIPTNMDVRSWIQMFQTLVSQPALTQNFDLMRIFKHIARGLGAKNVSDFEVKSAQPEQVDSMVQQGNIMPIQQAMGGSNEVK